jgi:hypothetical protein
MIKPRGIRQRNKKKKVSRNKNPWKCIMTYDRNTGNKIGNVCLTQHSSMKVIKEPPIITYI